MPITPPEDVRSIGYDTRDYWAQANAELDRLGERLAAIRTDVDGGDITIREAADERVQVLADHLAKLIGLRREYFGGDE
jgi:hypothetical protein